MGTQEAKVEQYLNQQVTLLGGITRKWVSPGHDGVPDRICILPLGIIYFVEVKTLSGKTTVRQERELDELKRLGCHTAVVYGTDGVNDLIKKMKASRA